MVKSFERGASPFMRWALSPFLLLFSVVFFFPLVETIDEENTVGAAVCFAVILLCLFGILALWGVPHTGRVVAGIIAGAYVWYMIDQFVVNFEGSWGFGGRRSDASPLNSILGFIAFGVPCLIFAMFGRFSICKDTEDAEWLDDFDEEEEFGQDFEEKD